MIGSGDAVALYPSCTARRSAEIVRETIEESGVRFEGINLKPNYCCNLGICVIKVMGFIKAL